MSIYNTLLSTLHALPARVHAEMSISSAKSESAEVGRVEKLVVRTSKFEMICIERAADDCGLIRTRISLSHPIASRSELFAAHLAYLLVCGRCLRAIKIAGAFKRVISPATFFEPVTHAHREDVFHNHTHTTRITTHARIYCDLKLPRRCAPIPHTVMLLLPSYSSVSLRASIAI